MQRFATPAQPGAPPFMVWSLDLADDGTTPADKSFIRIPAAAGPGCALRFRILVGSTAAADTVLHTNYPLDGSEYGRTQFHAKPFSSGSQTDLICEFRIQRPGPYQYYISYKSIDDDGADDGASANPMLERIYGAATERRTPTAYFLVDPQLTLGGSALPLDGIVLQSVGPKWLGPIDGWAAHLAAASALGYNMVHFLPLQQRGGSDSPYSLYDQLELSDDLFAGKPRGRAEKDQRLREALLEM
ncbi:bifunctional 4-alpha-glucanotransferase/amylo-alpha-1,6-glucosidase, partial [Coemansia helicoidea]